MSARRWLLTISLATNLGLLVFFKYFGFFVESAQELLLLLGMPLNTQTLNIVLPVGISFYTFQTLSYTVDVYRGKLQPTKNILDFALFVSFFPQLVAGPIVRAKTFLPQLDLINRWRWTRMQLGMQYFIFGLFKKLAIADRLAYYSDPIFSDVGVYGTSTLWLGAVAFTIQLYCDFSGYSDMAIGTANMLGFRLTKNFEMPLAAENISSFWRRWHISLSSWVRDYIYIPLGGSHDGPWKTNRNLIVTLTLVGLWHGAAWTFVIFGLLQGVMLVVHRYFRQFCRGKTRLQNGLESALGTSLRVILTFVCVCSTMVFFRAGSVSDAFLMLQRMFIPSEGFGVPVNERGFWMALVIVFAAHHLGQHRQYFIQLFDRVPTPIRGLAFAGIFTLALILSPEIDQAFIYFQF